MTLLLRKPSPGAIPIHLVERSALPERLASVEPAKRQWLQAVGFDGAPDTHALVAGPDGRIQEVWAGVRGAAHPWALAALPKALPAGRYRLAEPGLQTDDEAAALSWQLGGYAFTRYKAPRREPATLMLAPGVGARRGQAVAEAIAQVRDLVNTPAEDMGPAHLSDVVRALAKAHGARFREVTGDALLKAGFPAIHAVGRAAAREPRLIELNWGKPRHPKLVLVGKGVCFDSGGLDIKPADGMLLMKKDMGGAANAIGLARLIMTLGLPVQLQLLIPAVENAISGNA